MLPCITWPVAIPIMICLGLDAKMILTITMICLEKIPHSIYHLFDDQDRVRHSLWDPMKYRRISYTPLQHHNSWLRVSELLTFLWSLEGRSNTTTYIRLRFTPQTWTGIMEFHAARTTGPITSKTWSYELCSHRSHIPLPAESPNSLDTATDI